MMRRLLKWLLLGVILGTPAMLVLLLKALGVQVTDGVVRDFLQGYNDLLQLVLSIIEPLLMPIVAKVSSALGLSLRLGPHWMQMFQLLFVYLLADRRISLKTGRVLGGNIKFILGLGVSLATSVSVGVVPTNSGSVVDDLVIVAAASGAYFAYAVLSAIISGRFSREQHAKDAGVLVETYSSFVASRTVRAVRTSLVGLTIGVLSVVLLRMLWPQLQNAGIPALLLQVLALAAYWTKRAIDQAARKNKHAEGPTFADVWGMANFQLGVAMAGSILAAILTVWILWIAKYLA